MNKALRPSLSTTSMHMKFEIVPKTPVIINDDRSEALSPKPIVQKNTGALKVMTLIPITCWKNGIAIAITS